MKKETQTILDMLDLFYANKHMYEKLQRADKKNVMRTRREKME